MPLCKRSAIFETIPITVTARSWYACFSAVNWYCFAIFEYCSLIQKNQLMTPNSYSFIIFSFGKIWSAKICSANWTRLCDLARFAYEGTRRSSTRLRSPGGILPYKGLMGTCGQPGYVFRDFCLKQGIEFIIFCLKQDKCLKQGIKNRNSVLNRVGKSAIFVLNSVRVWGAEPRRTSPPRDISSTPPGCAGIGLQLFRTSSYFMVRELSYTFFLVCTTEVIVVAGRPFCPFFLLDGSVDIEPISGGDRINN